MFPSICVLITNESYIASFIFEMFFTNNNCAYFTSPLIYQKPMSDLLLLLIITMRFTLQFSRL